MKYMKFFEADGAAGGGNETPPPALTPPPASVPPASGTPPPVDDKKYSLTGDPKAEVKTVPDDHWSHKFDGIDDKIKGDPNLLKFKTPADALKAYVTVQPLIGADKVPIPKDWNDQGQLDAFASKIGRPEESKGYTPTVYEFPEGFAEDTPKLEAFKGMAHKIGMSQWQFQQLHKAYTDMQIGDLQSQQTEVLRQQTEGMIAYENELGSTRFQEEIQVARNAIRAYGNDEFETFLEDTGMNKDPRLLKVFAKVGKDIREGRSGANAGQQALFNAESPDGAAHKIQELKNDAAFQKTLNSRNDPKHKEANELWYSLHKRAHPEKKTTKV